MFHGTAGCAGNGTGSSRPPGPNVHFVQLDDLTAEQLNRVRPAAFIIHATSPGSHQAWIAVSGLPDDKEAFKAFMRRVRKAVGGNDKSASHATRVGGTENFKTKYIPNFPVVTILETTPGRIVTGPQLETLGLLTPPEAYQTVVVPLRSSQTQDGRGERHWPDYQRCVAGAPRAKEGEGPDRSMADFFWCLMAVRRGWSIEEAANKLLEVSEKAQERVRLGDKGYLLITAQNAAAAAARGRQQGRG